MKTGFLALLLLFAGLIAVGVDAPTEINLLDGSKLKGKITSNNGSEITVISDLVVFRIPLEKLTPESKAAVLEATKPDVEALLRKVAELEAKVSQLQQETNACDDEQCRLQRSPVDQHKKLDLTLERSTTKRFGLSSHVIVQKKNHKYPPFFHYETYFSNWFGPS